MDETEARQQRITLRLMAYWEKLRKGHAMPSENDIDPDDLQDLWEHCFLVHVQDLNKPDYSYTYLGDAILKAYMGELHADDVSGAVSPNAAKLADMYQKLVETRKPLVDEGEFYNLQQKLVKYRQCLLPLGEGDQVLAIFGGMRFKVFS